MLDERKIIFAGLDYGGKTSIILTLQEKFSSIDARPTKGIARSKLSYTKFLGFRFTTWDLGGQRKFRNTYFQKKKYRVFSNTHHLFYVIDMQDPERFEMALDYFSAILSTFETLKEEPKITILFHKIDPDIVPKKNKVMKKRVENLEKQIHNMDIPFKYSIFHTSIHDRATLLKAFSKGVIKREAKAKIIKERLKEYAKNTFSSAVVLLSKDYLEMASHYSKKDYLNVCESVAPHFIDAMSRLTDYNLIADNTTVDVQFDKDFRLGGQKLKSEDKTEQTEKENAVIFVKTFLVQGMKFHILSMSRNKRTIKLSEDHLPVLASHLENLITEMNA